MDVWHDRHRNNYILIFDEIHNACQPDTLAFGEQLKTMLDSGSGGLPYVIGITTEEEYYTNIYQNNSAFARRFKRIHIENTDPVETLEVLTHQLLRQAPKLIVENGVLQELQNKTRAAFSINASEPITSLKILSQCIQRTAESQKSSLEEKVEQLQKQIHLLQAQNAAGQGSDFLPYQRRPQVEQLENSLKQLEELVRQEHKELSRFFQRRDSLAETKNTLFKTIVKLAHLQRNELSAKNRNSLSFFLLLSHFLAPAQSSIVVNEAKRLGIKTTIDSALIDQVIKEELEIEKKARQAIDRGKMQILSRTKGQK